MVKPIGNLIANLKPKDKISAKTQARFTSEGFALSPRKPDASAPADALAAKAKPVRFKKRKR